MAKINQAEAISAIHKNMRDFAEALTHNAGVSHSRYLIDLNQFLDAVTDYVIILREEVEPRMYHAGMGVMLRFNPNN